VLRNGFRWNGCRCRRLASIGFDPFTIVAVAGVSSHGDRLLPRFCNTTTSLSRLPPTPTISVSLGCSANVLTLSSPFHTLDHAVSAFPSSCSRHRRLSSDVVSTSPPTSCLHFLRLSLSLSHEHSTTFSLTFSLHVCFTLAKKNLLHKTSAHT